MKFIFLYIFFISSTFGNSIDPLLESYSLMTGTGLDKLAPSVFEKTQSFFKDHKNDPILNTSKGEQLKRKFAKLSNYLSIKTGFEKCLKLKKGDKRNLSIRILDSAMNSSELELNCFNQFSEQKKLSELFVEVEIIAKKMMKPALQDMLYSQSLKNAISTYIAHKARYLESFENLKGEDILKKLLPKKHCKGLQKKINSSCDKNFYKSILNFTNAEMKRHKKTVKFISSEDASKMLNHEVDELNPLLEKIPIKTKHGIIKTRYWNSSDPHFTKETRAKYEDYQKRYLLKASTGVGQLMFADHLKKKMGFMRSIEDGGDIDEDQVNSTFRFYPHKKIIKNDVDESIKEIDEKIIDQTKNLNKLQKFKLKIDNYSKRSKGYNETRQRDQALKKLIKSNPAAVGQILIKNPEYTTLVCEIINKISIDDSRDEVFDKAWTYGGMIVGGVSLVGAGIMFASGIGAPVGAVLAAGGKTLLVKGAVTALAVGVGAGIAETGYWTKRTIEFNHEQHLAEISLLAGSGDSYSITDSKNALIKFKEARMNAGLGLGLSLLDLGALKYAAKLGRGTRIVAEVSGKKIVKGLKSMTKIYERIADDSKLLKRFAEVKKQLGKNGAKKMDQFLTILGNSKSGQKFLDLVANNKITPKKLKEIIEKAISKESCKL